MPAQAMRCSRSSRRVAIRGFNVEALKFGTFGLVASNLIITDRDSGSLAVPDLWESRHSLATENCSESVMFAHVFIPRKDKVYSLLKMNILLSPVKKTTLRNLTKFEPLSSQG